MEPAHPRADAISNALTANRLQLIRFSCFVIISCFVIRVSSFTSPAEMGKGAVGLRHFVGVFAFFDGVALA